jgi:hypothetical protein
MARKTIAQVLEEQRVLIFNASKPEILPHLERMGIDLPYLKTGEDLFNEVIELDKNQKKEYQEQDLAYDTYQEAKSKCEHYYKNTLTLLRMASKSDGNLQDRIKINKARESKIENWILQAIETYNLILNENGFLDKIAKYGLTAEKLQAERDEIRELQTLRNEAISEKGQAQEATRLRDEKRNELNEFCHELYTVATIALEDHPQLLEKIGIKMRT